MGGTRIRYASIPSKSSPFLYLQNHEVFGAVQAQNGDTENMKPKKEWEYGLKAKCWHCDKQFSKTDYCPTCGFYKCPWCGKCACQLTKDQKKVIDRTFEALAPILARNAKNRMGIHSHEH